MNNENAHGIHEWMQQLSSNMEHNYRQIRRHSREAPETAGGRGESDWAELLAGWLPPTLQVVTRGRIVDHKDNISPEMDVIVLKDVYPRQMLCKGDYFLSAGVLAAFECKATLRREHISEAVKVAGKVKQLGQSREGTPYAELYSPIIYGLLSHAHDWTQDHSRPEENVTDALWEADYRLVTHPRDCLDLICVANLGMWASWKDAMDVFHDGLPVSRYWTSTKSKNRSHFTPIGSLIVYLSRRLAWEIPALRPLADYYFKTGLTGTAYLPGRIWPFDIYSDAVLPRVMERRLSHPRLYCWDEWSKRFF